MCQTCYWLCATAQVDWIIFGLVDNMIPKNDIKFTLCNEWLFMCIVIKTRVVALWTVHCKRSFAYGWMPGLWYYYNVWTSKYSTRTANQVNRQVDIVTPYLPDYPITVVSYLIYRTNLPPSTHSKRSVPRRPHSNNGCQAFGELHSLCFRVFFLTNPKFPSTGDGQCRPLLLSKDENISHSCYMCSSRCFKL